jgi:hypothetical protein
VLATLVVIGSMGLAGAASAVSLYWAKTPVQSASVKDGLGFGYGVMARNHFQNIRRSADEVAGSSGATYAAITCIGTAPRVTAVIMVASDNAGEAARVRDLLRDQIKKIVRID